ncbi:hypothetical protein BDV97DRAFT_367556 [Delphinella strobiligena]|nr:hypothetical protein BDV97DRAFT_367556 [Delphinella strobiligena]
MDYRKHTHRDVCTSNHTSIESLPQKELLAPSQVPCDPVSTSRTLGQQILSQPVLAQYTDTPSPSSARSTSLPPHSKPRSSNWNPGGQTLVQRPDINMARPPSPRYKVSKMPLIPTYEQFPDIPSHLEDRRLADNRSGHVGGKSDHATGRSGSDPSHRGRQKRSASVRPQTTDTIKRDGSAGWRRRLKEAMKEFFRKEPIDDSQFERIEDRHWTE